MPDNARYVQFGVASHNLFDLCYAMLLREREGVRDQVEFEMLEGMANHQARVIRQAADGLLLYAPVVLKEDFHSATWSGDWMKIPVRRTSCTISSA